MTSDTIPTTSTPALCAKLAASKKPLQVEAASRLGILTRDVEAWNLLLGLLTHDAVLRLYPEDPEDGVHRCSLQVDYPAGRCRGGGWFCAGGTWLEAFQDAQAGIDEITKKGAHDADDTGGPAGDGGGVDDGGPERHGHTAVQQVRVDAPTQKGVRGRRSNAAAPRSPGRGQPADDGGGDRGPQRAGGEAEGGQAAQASGDVVKCPVCGVYYKPDAAGRPVPHMTRRGLNKCRGGGV